MTLILIDVVGVRNLAGKLSGAAERLWGFSGTIAGVQMPPMRGEDRAAVAAAVSHAASAVKVPVAKLRFLSGEMKARGTILQRDLQESIRGGVDLEGLAMGIWGGSDEALELAIARVRKKFGLSGEALARQIDKHHAIGRDMNTRVTGNDRARLRALREDHRFWKRWRNITSRLMEGPSSRILGRIGKVMGNAYLAGVLDSLSVALNSPMLNSKGSKGVAGVTFAGGQAAYGIVPGGAIFALVDAAILSVAGEKSRYGQVSITRMNTVTAQTVGAVDQAIRTGDYSGLQAIHQMHLDGRTTIPQTAGAYIGDLYSGGFDADNLVARHDAALAGQQGAGAQNMAVAGETVNEMVTNPGGAIGGAWDYWRNKWKH